MAVITCVHKTYVLPSSSHGSPLLVLCLLPGWFCLISWLSFHLHNINNHVLRYPEHQAKHLTTLEINSLFVCPTCLKFCCISSINNPFSKNMFTPLNWLVATVYRNPLIKISKLALMFFSQKFSSIAFTVTLLCFTFSIWILGLKSYELFHCNRLLTGLLITLVFNFHTESQVFWDRNLIMTFFGFKMTDGSWLPIG